MMSITGNTLNSATTDQMLPERMWWGYLFWVLAGAALGFTIAAIFAGIFHMPRNSYLIPYVVMVSVFLYAYVHWSKLSLGQCFHHRWDWGLVGAVIVGVFVVQSVLGQPSSPTPSGVELAVDLFWLGVVYGALDGLLLSVLPVLAVREALTKLGWTQNLSGRVGTGLLAVVSMAVIAVYHLGYPEFRSLQLVYPVVGVSVMSLAYIVTGNPMAAVISHVAMHIAAVLHGVETVMQLPPHY
jgi:hypothetical protein